VAQRRAAKRKATAERNNLGASSLLGGSDADRAFKYLTSSERRDEEKEERKLDRNHQLQCIMLMTNNNGNRNMMTPASATSSSMTAIRFCIGCGHGGVKPDMFCEKCGKKSPTDL
jgi:hypothetical protein